MTQPKRDLLFAVVAVVVGSALMLLLPDENPQRCDGPVQKLFWNCTQ